jgi:predicted esterase
MLRQARGRARIVIVEKPGVRFLDVAQDPGSALGASAEFLAEHTLERWSEANITALRAALQLPGADRARVLICGHSEGGNVAAHVAASRNTLDDLLLTHARVFLAHGTEDNAVPVISFDWLRAELAARGRAVTAPRVPGVDHGFFGPEGPPHDMNAPGGLERMFGHVLDWLLGAS